MSKHPLIIVCGPTASGKSALAVRLAKQLGSEILNIDSVQIFKGFDIGSGKTSLNEQKGIRHHLLDCREPGQDINVAEFLEEAQVALNDITARGLGTIAVGGTGLYVKALIHGLALLPAPDLKLRAELDGLSTPELASKLSELDPELLKRISQNDRSRLIRGIEIALSDARGGSKASEIQDTHRFSQVIRPAIILCLVWPRKKLTERINNRVAQMLEQGLVDETTNLIKKYGANLQGLEALGYAQVVEYLNGELPFERLGEEIALKTRQFSKRQLTFWRNQPKKLGWIIRPNTSEGVEIAEDTAVKRNKSRMKSTRVYAWSFDQLISNLSQHHSSSSVEIWYLSAEKL